MDIYRCQAKAKDIGFDSATFDLVGPSGRLKCKWLDAYFGMFEVEGEEGFITVNQIADADDVYCENLAAPDQQQTK